MKCPRCNALSRLQLMVAPDDWWWSCINGHSWPAKVSDVPHMETIVMFEHDTKPDKQEGIKMPKVNCSVTPCEKWAQIQGKCKSHFNGSTPRKPRNNAPESAEPKPVPSDKTQPLHAHDLTASQKHRSKLNAGRDPQTSGITIDPMACIDAIWIEHRSEMLRLLQNANIPDRLFLAIKFIDKMNLLGISA